ncbi:MAG: hypothetical protein FWC34_10905 [Bacteroidetes bacterium]|nr:hypothetical protein [Bacteroidota bacterium]MCL2302949.1 hypothetical protein [Lentimicrobiaceae bacterium]
MKNIDNFALSLTNRKSTEQIKLNEVDFVEIIDSGILEGIPHIGKIISTYKGFINLRDKIFIKKFIRFLQDFENQNIDEQKLDDFKNKIQNDKNYRIKITETLIEYIDDLKNTQKIGIYCNLFASYVNGDFDWEHFLQLTDCLERVDLKNLVIIPRIDTKKGKEVQNYDEDRVTAEGNLQSSGLVIKMSVWSADIYPTQFGRDIYKYGLKNTISNSDK